MKQPIKPSEIRFGDLIRWESDKSDTAREFRQTDPNSRHTAPGSYYLLDRPTPPVTLPTEPTLGWASNGHSTIIGEWYLDDGGQRLRFADAQWGWVVSTVTAFTPAVAVPTETLDALRASVEKDNPIGLMSAVYNLLAAIDAASGSTS